MHGDPYFLFFEVVVAGIISHLYCLFSVAHPLSSLNLHLCYENNATS